MISCSVTYIAENKFKQRPKKINVYVESETAVDNQWRAFEGQQKKNRKGMNKYGLKA